MPMIDDGDDGDDGDRLLISFTFCVFLFAYTHSFSIAFCLRLDLNHSPVA